MLRIVTNGDTGVTGPIVLSCCWHQRNGTKSFYYTNKCQMSMDSKGKTAGIQRIRHFLLHTPILRRSIL